MNTQIQSVQVSRRRRRNDHIGKRLITRSDDKNTAERDINNPYFGF
jgi:hypothetical protein